MSAKRRMIGLDDQLVQNAAEALGLSSTRDVIAVAVRRHLTNVVEQLLLGGLEVRPPVLRKQRTIDDKTWDVLAQAGERVPLGQVEILRCCLTLAAREKEAT